MANHKSSKKRILVTIKKNTINTARRSAVKTETKKALAAIATGDKAAGKVMPKKRAARKVSRLTKKLAKIA